MQNHCHDHYGSELVRILIHPKPKQFDSDMLSKTLLKITSAA